METSGDEARLKICKLRICEFSPPGVQDYYFSNLLVKFEFWSYFGGITVRESDFQARGGGKKMGPGMHRPPITQTSKKDS